MALFQVHRQTVETFKTIECWVNISSELVEGEADDVVAYVENLNEQQEAMKLGSYLAEKLAKAEVFVFLEPHDFQGGASTKEYYVERVDILRTDLAAFDNGTLDVTKYEKEMKDHKPTYHFVLEPVKMIAKKV